MCLMETKWNCNVSHYLCRRYRVASRRTGQDEATWNYPRRSVTYIDCTITRHRACALTTTNHRPRVGWRCSGTVMYHIACIDGGSHLDGKVRSGQDQAKSKSLRRSFTYIVYY